MQPVTTTQPATGRRWLVVGVVAFLGGVAAIVGVIAAGSRYLDRFDTVCQQFDHPSHLPVPGYLLPLGIVSTGLMAVALGGAIISRRSPPAKVLIALAVLGLLFCAWFGVVAVLSDMSDTAVHCGG
jgi:hypothetical protein